MTAEVTATCVPADNIYSCSSLSGLGFQSHLIDGLSGIFSVTPCDARRAEIIRRVSIGYNDLLVRADHPTVSSHRYRGQHVVT